MTTRNAPGTHWLPVHTGLAFDVEVLVHDFLDCTGVVRDVGITMDGVFDHRAGHREIDHIHGLVTAHHGVDQAGGEGVAAAHTVEDVEGEELALEGITGLHPHPL